MLRFIEIGQPIYRLSVLRVLFIIVFIRPWSLYAHVMKTHGINSRPNLNNSRVENYAVLNLCGLLFTNTSYCLSLAEI